jgi:hypothetical protein
VTVFDLGLENGGARSERWLRSDNPGRILKRLHVILTDKVGIFTHQLGKLPPGALRRTAKAVDEENEFLHDTLLSVFEQSMDYDGIKRDRPCELTQEISRPYPTRGNNFHQRPSLSREHKGRRKKECGTKEREAGSYLTSPPLPLSASPAVHGADLTRGIIDTVPRDLIEDGLLSCRIVIGSRTDTNTGVGEQVPQFRFRVGRLRKPDASCLGLSPNRRNQRRNEKA